MYPAKTQAVRGQRPGLSASYIAFVANILVLAGNGAHSQTPPPPSGRLIARAGTELEARADGTACAQRVKVIITSTNPQLFEGEIPAAAKFFTNARAGHSLSCPQMTRMVAQGNSNGKIMFTAMADQSNGWEALILGATILDSRTEEAALASTGPTPKSVFRSSPGFTQASNILSQTKDKFLCVAGQTLGCEMILEFAASGADKAVITNRHALSGGKSAAVITTTAAIRDGFFCADPSTSSVVVEDAQMSDDARKDYADQLLDRVRSNGEICTGFSSKVDALTIYGFDASGTAMDRPRAITVHSSLPSFNGST